MLFSTELWERFSYYGMRAVLVLYLTDLTANGGMGWTQADALKLYGIYTGLVYITPIIGGWLADTFLGQRRAILFGAVLMAAGQFTLALPHAMFPDMVNTVFYAGLGLLIVGNGLFKPNISTMVGDLYKEGDHRRDGAFTIFYMGINLGSLLAGVICGAAATAYGWQAAFVSAGIGMLLSLVVQATMAQRFLGDIGRVPAAQRAALQRSKEQKAPLTKQEVDRIKVILVLGLFTIIFWAGFEQAGGPDEPVCPGVYRPHDRQLRSADRLVPVPEPLLHHHPGPCRGRHLDQARQERAELPGEIRHGPAVPGRRLPVHDRCRAGARW